MDKENIANYVGNVVNGVIDGRKPLNRVVILINSDTEKKEVLSCIDTTLNQSLPSLSIIVLRIDLSTIMSASELSEIIKKKALACQDEVEETGKYGLFVFDNLDQANEDVLNCVKGMYHDGRNCRMPSGWEFISFCKHNAKIWDASFKISTVILEYNKEV